MGTCYINQTIEIPIRGSGRSINLTPEINGDVSRTAGGTLRYDISTGAVKRQWGLQTELLTVAEHDAIYNYLVSISFGFCDFWLAKFGGTAATNSIKARVVITGSQRDKSAADERYSISITATEQ